jgi:hypothetical protein
MLLPEIEGHQELGKDAVLRAYPDRYKPVPMRALITTSSRPSANMHVAQSQLGRSTVSFPNTGVAPIIGPLTQASKRKRGLWFHVTGVLGPSACLRKLTTGNCEV